MHRRHLSNILRPCGTVRALIVLILVVCTISGAITSQFSGTALAASESAAVKDAPTATAPASAVFSPKPMIFSDDFEAYGDDSLWDLSQEFPVQTDIVANGMYAARLTNDGGTPVYGRKSLNHSYDRVFARVRFKVNSTGSKPTTLIDLRPSATRSVIAIQLQPDGSISYRTGATDIIAQGSTKLTTGVWHELQVFVDTTTQEHNVRVWIDQAELTSMRQSAYLGTDGVRTLDLGDNSAGQRSDIAFDDVAMDSSFIPSVRTSDPIPGTLVVHAIPNWAGIKFELDGKTFVTDSQGVVRIDVGRWSTDLRSRIKVLDNRLEDGSAASFTGWQHWRSPHSKEIDATFRISEPITFSFVDMSGASVDSSMIDSLVIKSKAGDIVTFSGADLAGATLPTSTVINTPKGLSIRSTEYMVDQVFIGGTNVVHRAQQRNTFATSRHWTISLLFYGVTFRAKDAFFGSPIGKSIIVQSADGSQQHLSLDENGEVVIPRLPRGEYSVSVMGGGYSPPRPIMVSRGQEVDLKVISELDVLLLISLVGVAVLGLVIIGRPFLVTRPARSFWFGLASLRMYLAKGLNR